MKIGVKRTTYSDAENCLDDTVSIDVPNEMNTMSSRMMLVSKPISAKIIARS